MMKKKCATGAAIRSINQKTRKENKNIKIVSKTIHYAFAVLVCLVILSLA